MVFEFSKKISMKALFYSAAASILITFLLFATACTYAITMVHTEGVAQDVVDEVQEAKGALNVPALQKK